MKATRYSTVIFAPALGWVLLRIITWEPASDQLRDLDI